MKNELKNERLYYEIENMLIYLNVFRFMAILHK